MGLYRLATDRTAAAQAEVSHRVRPSLFLSVRQRDGAHQVRRKITGPDGHKPLSAILLRDRPPLLIFLIDLTDKVDRDVIADAEVFVRHG
jgi:hypothetical protein